MLNSDPELRYEIPPSYDLDWTITVFGCANGQEIEQVGGDYTISVPPDGVFIAKNPNFASDLAVYKVSMSGSLDNITSSTVRQSENKVIMGANPMMCMYSYTLLSGPDAVASGSLELAVQAACQRCEMPEP
jgi:hypothetical protein